MVDRTLRRIFMLAGLAVLVWIIYLLKPVVLPFVGAFLIAYLFSPLVNKLHDYRFPRWLAISCVFIGIGFGLTLASWYLFPLIWQQLLTAKEAIPQGIKMINNQFLPWLSDTFNLIPMEIDVDQFSNVAMDYIQTNYSADSVRDMLTKLAQSGMNFIQIGGTIVLIPVITFYFLLDWDRMMDGLRRLIPRPYEKRTMHIVRECHEVLGAFVKGQILVMVLLGLVYAVGLQLIGLEVGLIIGMVAGLCSIIPYLGFAVGVIAAIVATLFQFGLDWWQLVLVGIVFMIGQAVEGYILQPFLLGDKIGLSPVAVVFAVLAGAQLAGFLGMLIALPVAAVIVVLLRHARNSYEHSRIYGLQADASYVTSTTSISVEIVEPEIVLDEQNNDTIKQQVVEKTDKIENDPSSKN